MDCRNCEDHFTAVLEEADSTGAQASREHLEVCPACRARFESYRQTVHDLRALPPVTPPPGLLREISRSLDTVAPTRPAWTQYWQPVTAGVSMAACVMMVLWAVVLNPSNALVTSNGSYVTDTAGFQPAAMGQAALPAPVTAAVPARAAGAPAAVRQPRLSMRPGFGGAVAARQAAFRPFPAQFGQWGHSVPATFVTSPSGASPAPANNSVKPADSFAAPATAAVNDKPLHKAPGEVQIAFLPPTERVVGELAVGQVLITSQAEANIAVRVAPRGSLRVTNAPGGLLYEGPLRKGDKLKLPVRMVSNQTGRQRMQLSLTGDVEGVATDMLIVVPEFSTAPRKPVERSITLVFRDTASFKAIRDLASAAGARVVLDDGLEPQLVNYDFSAGVPFAVALRTLCDGCGYRLSEREGVCHVSK